MALVALTKDELSKPRRIEGHTSNVVAPIEYSELGDISVGTLVAGASFVIPTELTDVSHVNITGTNAGGSVVVWAAKNAPAISSEALGATSVAGATSVKLGSSASTVNDVYNGCTIDITINGITQSLKILDYVGSTKTATLDGSVEEALTADATYQVRGIIVTSIAGATTPSYSVEVVGTTSL